MLGIFRTVSHLLFRTEDLMFPSCALVSLTENIVLQERLGKSSFYIVLMQLGTFKTTDTQSNFN